MINFKFAVLSWVILSSACENGPKSISSTSESIAEVENSNLLSPETEAVINTALATFSFPLGSFSSPAKAAATDELLDQSQVDILTNQALPQTAKDLVVISSHILYVNDQNNTPIAASLTPFNICIAFDSTKYDFGKSMLVLQNPFSKEILELVDAINIATTDQNQVCMPTTTANLQLTLITYDLKNLVELIGDFAPLESTNRQERLSLITIEHANIMLQKPTEHVLDNAKLLAEHIIQGVLIWNLADKSLLLQNITQVADNLVETLTSSSLEVEQRNGAIGISIATLLAGLDELEIPKSLISNNLANFIETVKSKIDPTLLATSLDEFLSLHGKAGIEQAGFDASESDSLLKEILETPQGQSETEANTAINAVKNEESQLTPVGLVIKKAANQDSHTFSLPAVFIATFSDSIPDGQLTAAKISQAGTATGVVWQVKRQGKKQDTFRISATALTESGSIIPAIAKDLITIANGATNNTANASEEPVFYHQLTASLTLPAASSIVGYRPFTVRINAREQNQNPVQAPFSLVFEHNADISSSVNPPSFLTLTPNSQTIEFAAGETNKDIQLILPQSGLVDFTVKFPLKEQTLTTEQIAINNLSAHNEIGEGSPESPYLLYTSTQIEDFLSLDETISDHYKLMADIDLQSITISPYPASFNFAASFAGNNFTLSNLAISQPSADHVGFFPQATSAAVSDLTLENFAVEGQNYVGALIGLAHARVELANITLTYPSDPDSDRMVKGASYVGGLIGAVANQSTTAFKAAVHSTSALRYTTGEYSTLSEITMTNPEVEASDDYAGSVIGYLADADLSDFALSNLSFHSTGGDRQGGVIGQCIHCRAHKIQASGSFNRVAASEGDAFGGLFGRIDASLISTCSSEVAITTNQVGNSSDIGDEQLGGIAGMATYSSHILSSKASGNVSGGVSVGGLVGVLGGASVISASYATGDITGGGNANGSRGVGGIVGNSDTAQIFQSYATGDVSGVNSNRNGGLLGRALNTLVQSSFSTGAVSGGTNYATSFSGASAAAVQLFRGDGSCDSCSGGLSASSTTNEHLQSLPSDGVTPFPLADWDGWDDPTDSTDDSSELDLDVWVFQDGQFPKLWFEVESAATAPSLSGSGTSQDPYLIAIEDIKRIQNPRFYNAYFKVTSTDDPYELTEQLSTNGLSFTGELDFDGLTLTDALDKGWFNNVNGLFDHLNYGSHLKNLNIDDLQLTNAKDRAGIVARSGFHLENISISANASITGGARLGSVVGHVFGSEVPFKTAHLQQVASAADLNGTNTGRYSGGILGRAINMIISKSTYSGDLFANSSTSIGGVIGVTQGLVGMLQSSNTGTVTASEISSGFQGVGGLIGTVGAAVVTMEVYDSYNSGSVTVNDHISNTGYGSGGLFGVYTGAQSSSLTVYNAFNTGASSGTGQVGGILGLHKDGALKITNVFNAGAITSLTNAGHIVAEKTASETPEITDAYYDDENLDALGGYSDGTSVLNSNDLKAAAHPVYGTWDFSQIWNPLTGSEWPDLQ